MSETQFIEKEDEFISSNNKEKIMEITIKAVSEGGILDAADGITWHNKPRNSDMKLKGVFFPGDIVEVKKDAKGTITSVELVTKAPEKKAWTGGGKSFGGGKSSEFRTTEQIIRSEAAKAAFCVLAGPVVKDMSKEEAQSYAFELAEHVATFIEKGV